MEILIAILEDKELTFSIFLNFSLFTGLGVFIGLMAYEVFKGVRSILNLIVEMIELTLKKFERTKGDVAIDPNTRN